jgi:hypothetical protein
MADLISVDPTALTTNTGTIQSPGANAYFGLQQELIRRAALARQAQLDDEQRQRDALQAEATRENIATSKMQREATAQLKDAQTQKLQEDQFLKTHGAGDQLAPEDQQVAVKLFGKGAVASKPAMTAGVPTEFAAAPDAASAPEVKQTPESATFAGTVEERKNAKVLGFAQEILDGAHDTGDEKTDELNHAWATQVLLSGKPGATLSGITGKSQAEKDSTRYFNTRAAQAQKKPVSPDDAAFADSYEKIHPTEATKQQERVLNINLTGALASGRQQAGFANAAQTTALKELDKEYEGLNLGRLAKLADTLKSPGGINDVVATPELLSAMAGGNGAGLRMSQAELNMIQNARPLLDSLIIKGGNILGINQGGYAALSAEQRAQMQKLLLEVASNNLAMGQNILDAQHEINNLDKPSQADVFKVLESRKQKELEMFGKRLGVKSESKADAAAPSAPSKYKVSISD